MCLRTVFAGPKTEPALNAAVGDFVSGQLWGEPGRFERFASMAVFDGSTLIAGMLFHNWHREHGTIEISGAAMDRRWLTRRVLNEMFGMPFDRWGCQTIVMRCDPADERLKRMLGTAGFTAYWLPRLRGRKQGEVIYLLHDDVWRANPLYRPNCLPFPAISWAGDENLRPEPII